MTEVFQGIVSAPIATLFILAGMIFLLIAVLGNISGKIEPGSKGRLASGFFGMIFIVLGLAIHFAPGGIGDQDPAEKATIDQRALEEAHPLPDQNSPNEQRDEHSGLPTNFDGILATITRFDKVGQLLLLEIQLTNLSGEPVLFCIDLWNAKLIDEDTGDDWSPIQYGGRINCSVKQELSSQKQHLAWMQFKVKKPETKKFSLATSELPRPVTNLRLGEG